MILQVDNVSVTVTGIALLRYTKRYLEGAQGLKPYADSTNSFDPVPYYLLCSSLELHLKVYIWLVDRLGTNQLKRTYGHNIEKLWNDSKVRGLDQFLKPTPLRDEIIDLIDPFYHKKRLNYLDLDMMYDDFRVLTNDKRVLPTLDRLCKKLCASLYKPVRDAAIS